MDANEYQQEVQRTMRPGQTTEQQLANYALGLTGEAGEAADIVKKHLYHGHTLDVDALIKEAGDTMWYAAAICSVLGVPFGDALLRNVDKLRKRYPAGFSTQASLARVDVAEPNPLKSDAHTAPATKGEANAY